MALEKMFPIDKQSSLQKRVSEFTPKCIYRSGPGHIIKSFLRQYFLPYLNKLECLPNHLFGGKAGSQPFELSPVWIYTLVTSSLALIHSA